MSITSLAEQVTDRLGRTDRAVLVTEDGAIRLHVTLHDVRTVWSRTDVLVRPVTGSGEKWVSLERLERLPETAEFASV